jgi:hypothetical protein
LINLCAINDWGSCQCWNGIWLPRAISEATCSYLHCDCYGPGIEYGTDPFTIYIHGSETTDKQYGIKDEVVVGTSLGTHLELGELFGNLMRMGWELHGNRQKTKKNPLPPRAPAHTPKKTERKTLSLPN